MTWRRNLRYSHSASQALLWPESFSSDFTFTATIYLLYSVVVGHVRKRTSRPWRLSSLDHHQAVNTISTDQFVDSSHTLARTIHKLNTIRPPRNAFPTPFHVTTFAEGALILIQVHLVPITSSQYPFDRHGLAFQAVQETSIRRCSRVVVVAVVFV